MTPNRLITLAIHTYEKALPIKALLEREGVYTELNNVNLSLPETSPGVRIRIREADLPLALRIIENVEIFSIPEAPASVMAGKILVPTNFSDYSLNAARQAICIAHSIGCEVEFLYAYISPINREFMQLSDSYDYELSDIAASQLLQKEAEELMRQFTSKIRKEMKVGHLPAVKFVHRIEEGLPEEAILEYIRENKPALVVMGTRAALKKEEELIGSVTAEVLDACRVPAVTVPENVDADMADNLSKVAFFCNLDQEDILTMDTLYRMFPNKHLKVSLIHIPVRGLRRPTLPIFKQTIDSLMKYCTQHYSRFEFEQTEIERPLNEVTLRAKSANNSGFDMLCIPNKRKNMITRVFNPSLAHRILFRTDIPMFVVPV